MHVKSVVLSKSVLSKIHPFFFFFHHINQAAQSNVAPSPWAQPVLSSWGMEPATPREITITLKRKKKANQGLKGTFPFNQNYWQDSLGERHLAKSTNAHCLQTFFFSFFSLVLFFYLYIKYIYVVQCCFFLFKNCWPVYLSIQELRNFTP